MSNALTLIGQIINNVSLAYYRLNNLVYRAEPIKQRQELVIPNLKEGQVTVADFFGELPFNLLVTSVDADLVIDDEQFLQTDDNERQQINFAYIFVNVINRKTESVVKQLIFPISSFTSNISEIIIRPEFIYEIKPSRAINLITITGVPVHLLNPIVFLNGTVKEALTPRRNRRE